MLKPHTPPTIAPPAALYVHGMEAPPGARWLFISGQVGVHPDGRVGSTAHEQAEIIWGNIQAILGSAQMGMTDIVKLTTYSVSTEHLKALREVREPVGKSNEHLAYPGTLTLGAETLARVWTELGESVARAGIRRLVLFNSHGGQPQVMEIVARELRVRLGLMAVASSWYSFGVPDGLFPAEELKHGIHGGSVETSMMLHLRPDLVRQDERRNFRSLGQDMARDYALLGPTATAKLAWQTQDLNSWGACGDATDADAERGAKVVDHAARRFVALLEEVDRFPLTSLRAEIAKPEQG